MDNSSAQSTPPAANRGPAPEFQDLTLYDVETGEPFTFTAKEQEFYWKQGFTNVPKYTPERRKLKRLERTNGKELYNVRCVSCGKVGRILTEPTHPKKTLCEVCFMKQWEPFLEKHPEIKAEHEAAEKAAAEATALYAQQTAGMN